MAAALASTVEGLHGSVAATQARLNSGLSQSAATLSALTRMLEAVLLDHVSFGAAAVAPAVAPAMPACTPRAQRQRGAAKPPRPAILGFQLPESKTTNDERLRGGHVAVARSTHSTQHGPTSPGLCGSSDAEP